MISNAEGRRERLKQRITNISTDVHMLAAKKSSLKEEGLSFFRRGKKKRGRGNSLLLETRGRNVCLKTHDGGKKEGVRGGQAGNSPKLSDSRRRGVSINLFFKQKGDPQTL